MDNESPLVSRRELEAKQSLNTSTPTDCHSSSKVGWSPPLYNLSSLASEDISLGSLITCSLKPKETASESALESSAAIEENEQQRTQCRSERSCSDDVAELPPVKTDLDIVRVDAKQKQLPNMAVDFDFTLVSERMAVLQRDGEALVGKETEEEEGSLGGEGRRFRAKIDPASNNQAEEELRKQIR